jgi:predicted O-methyltransferase YrrM
LGSVGIYDELRAAFDGIHGFLHPQEGFALYHFARNGPGRGAIVEIGSLFGRSTCWLAAGTRDAGRGKVVAVDHFRGSPEHQKDGAHAIAAVAQAGTTFPAFIANLQRVGIRNWVEVRVGASAEIGSGWKGPIRFLFIDGDHSYEATRADVETWSKHLIPGGILALHDVDVWPGVTQMYRELVAEQTTWKQLGRVRSLTVLQRTR